MRLLRVVRGSVVLVGLLLNEAAWADAFVNFFYQQKVGQEITATGRFRRFSYQKQFFRRDDKTGEVEYFYYFGMSMMPFETSGPTTGGKPFEIGQYVCQELGPSNSNTVTTGYGDRSGRAVG